MFQPQSCCVWYIEAFGAICSPQAGFQHTHCRFSIEGDEALASYSLLEWREKWICSILNQLQYFMLSTGSSDTVKHIDNESRGNEHCPCEGSNFFSAIQKVWPLNHYAFLFLFSIYMYIYIISIRHLILVICVPEEVLVPHGVRLSVRAVMSTKLHMLSTQFL